MRYKLFSQIILMILFISSCSLFDPYEWQPPDDINSHEKMEELVLSIDYVLDTGLGSWHLPETTYSTMKGDCNDTSGLMASIMIYNFNYSDVRLVGCISKISGVPHILVYADGIYYDSFNGQEIENFKERYIFTNFMSYETYIFLARIN